MCLKKGVLATNCTLQAKCDTAESHFKHECVRTVFAAGEENWRARAWILERRYRDEFTTKSVVELKEEEGERFDPTRALIEAITYRVRKIDDREKQKEEQLKRVGTLRVS